eukprot:CAMPEP_0113889712 /NCGR_PEP_ID=MMETSP0780_2-20120614/13674_1 /TAXON_ID=652834 /ORGANISM="Palpitomonas bilix" /LENGTH=343 /DNA_ID=CAMNT_0000878891 /DNA_START=265 /DNA_END=1293 /DNA_ORIENTATION=- /assembly_acc=CAM_ASM_000599
MSTTKKTPSRHAALGEMKVRLLRVIQRLEDRDTTAKAGEELRGVCESLPLTQVAGFIATLIESVEHPLKKGYARREVIRLLADSASYHAESLDTSMVTRVVAALTKACGDKDSGVREECAEAMGSLVISLPSLPSFRPFFQPLCSAMEGPSPDQQQGAALALQAVVSAPALIAAGEGGRGVESAKEKAMAIASSVEKGLVAKLLKILNQPTFVAASSLLMVFGRLAAVVPVALSPKLPTLFNALPGWLASKDHAVRRGAATTLAVIARLGEEESAVGAALTSRRKEQLLLTLEACRFDKIKAVREAVVDAIEALSAVGEAVVRSEGEEGEEERRGEGHEGKGG